MRGPPLHDLARVFIKAQVGNALLGKPDMAETGQRRE